MGADPRVWTYSLTNHTVEMSHVQKTEQYWHRVNLPQEGRKRKGGKGGREERKGRKEEGKKGRRERRKEGRKEGSGGGREGKRIGERRVGRAGGRTSL